MSVYDDWLRKPEIQAAIQAGEIEISSFKVEPTNGGYWAFEDILQEDLPDTPLHQLLRWIVQQINMGHYLIEKDRAGRAVSLILGREVGVSAGSRDERVRDVRRRFLAVNIMGVLARAREGGIEPRFANLARQVAARGSAPGGGWGRLNTDLHYAFELIEILSRVHHRSWALSALPILGRTSDAVRSQLREASRCHLFALHAAAIALCRACLEETLVGLIPPKEVEEQRRASRPHRRDGPPGKLVLLIEAAVRLSILGREAGEAADMLRVLGNKAMHEKRVAAKDSQEAIEKLRFVLHEIYPETEA